MSMAQGTLFGASYALFLLIVSAAIKALGRRVAREDSPVPTWPRSDVIRFHHGMSLGIAFVSAFVVFAALLRHHDAADLALLCPTGALCVGAFARSLACFARPR